MGNEGFPIILSLIFPILMFLAVAVVWIISIVLMWRTMKAHELIAESIRRIAEKP